MMKLKIVAFFLISTLNAFCQKTADEVINKYLEVTNIKKTAPSITDIIMSSTSESPRGVAETEQKYAFPFKFSMTVYSNGMEIMSTKYNGDKLVRKSNWGGAGQAPKTGKEATNEALRSHPFIEMEYANAGFATSFVATEKVDGIDYDVVEIKDTEGKTWKDYFNTNTGFKERSFFIMETPRGKNEVTVKYENYKAYKGCDILFPSIRKQGTPMGEISSELQSIKINKGVKSKDFDVE